MKKTDTPLSFILGVERCGSTWLSNIFDCSPETLFYMEPFTAFAEIFPGFPDRLSYISSKSVYLEDLLVKGFEDLYSYKYPLFYAHKTTGLGRALTAWLLQTHDKILRLSKGRSALKYVRFSLLNLHQSEKKEKDALKDEHPKITCVKELRLNFKAGLLNSVFPDSSYIVIVRNPLSQIGSILNLFARNSLGQLKQELHVFFEHVENSNRFVKYNSVIKKLDAASLFDRLVAYWFINYNTLIEDLAFHKCKYAIVRHEDLCESPESISKELSDFVGCRYDSAVEEYIINSSNYENTPSASPVDTRRNSKLHYVEALKTAKKNIGSAFMESAEGFWEKSPEEIQSYKTILGDN